ncbi:hypothetical protein A1O7_04427 [Cladophialophora yegresii CBS 114405]|uniref:Uncharacterized protein n=1 Tax=Cladophialophora yegresii CBS 114405 TaxID=1182544 RepID=W9W5J1_9EURO|nr:uncharacterized protein A1O7_04427 [Cladophialophora yegresii CBS 114405]EXJ60275.1 hypothetical protein A1O7_04427 [Cladophialophora yegresii CBS 114405]
MREVTDTALQRLYWACRRKTGFPGSIPDESTGVVATTDILKGMGLIRPEFDEFELPKEMEQTLPPADRPDRAKRPLLAIKPRGHEDDNDIPSSASSYSTASSPPVLGVQTCQGNTSPPATPFDEIDMKDQFLAYSPAAKPVRPVDKIQSPVEHIPLFHQGENIADSHHMDVEAFLDMSFCAPATSAPQPVYSNYRSTPFRMPPMAAPHLPDMQSLRPPPDLIYDGFLSPWPGSLAAANQSVAI